VVWLVGLEVDVGGDFAVELVGTDVEFRLAASAFGADAPPLRWATEK
jgi:hypothetical protein